MSAKDRAVRFAKGLTVRFAMDCAEAEDPEVKEKEQTPSKTGTKNGAGDAPPQVSSKYEKTRTFVGFLAGTELTLRLLTLLFCFFYCFSIGENPSPWLRDALVIYMITSAIQLYQRSPQPFALTKEFLMSLLRVDSCHYVIYSFVLNFDHVLNIAVLVPILLYSSLEVAKTILTRIETVRGPIVRESGLGSFLFYYTSQEAAVLYMGAGAEIGLLANILLNFCRGFYSIWTIFGYYIFLSLRYASERNPEARTLLNELRFNVEQLIIHPWCPSLISKMVTILIGILCWLAPEVPSN